MKPQIWRVRLADRAEVDLSEIATWTRREFGPRQADAYIARLLAALQVLEDGPDARGTLDRSDLQPGLRVLRPLRAKHIFLLSNVGGTTERTINILRILHTAMDPSRHLDPDDAPA